MGAARGWEGWAGVIKEFWKYATKIFDCLLHLPFQQNRPTLSLNRCSPPRQGCFNVLHGSLKQATFKCSVCVRAATKRGPVFI